MAADIEPPMRIFVHSHWVVDGVKMSKSLGNVVDPMTEKDQFTVDGLRYFLLRHAVLHNDTNYSHEKAKRIINAELCNLYANLVSRCTHRKMNPKASYPCVDRGQFGRWLHSTKDAEELVKFLDDLKELVSAEFSRCQFFDGIDQICQALRMANAFYQSTQPWKLDTKSEQGRELLDSINLITYECLRICSILLQPVCPSVASDVLDRFSISSEERLYANAHFNVNDRENLNLTDSSKPVFIRLL